MRVTRREIRVEGAAPYRVVIGDGVLAEARGFVEGWSRVAIVSDAHVAPLWSRALELPEALVVTIEPGEPSKRFAVLEDVLDRLAAGGLDRRSGVLALGGGVVGDLAGLAAALFQRGVPIVHCPTSLLSQVDSAVGGKTAVNLAAGKNLAGAFHSPAGVIADTSTLRTLPDEELRSGLGEVLKTALIAGEEALCTIERVAPALLDRDEAALVEVVALCVATKARIVGEDEREAGPRRALNLGHSFAHAIEAAAGLGAVPHGVAVGLGVALALRASERVGVLEEASLLERVERLLARLGLPVRVADLPARFSVEAALAALAHDKKATLGEVEFVLPRRAGSLELARTLPRELVAALLEA